MVNETTRLLNGRWPDLTSLDCRDSIKLRSVQVAIALQASAIEIDDEAAAALIGIGIEIIRRTRLITREELLDLCAKIIDCPEKSRPEADTRGT